MDQIQLFSLVTKERKKKMLFRGVFFSLIGSSFWIFGFFLTGSIMIAIGMVPYRKLLALESNPAKLSITTEGVLYSEGPRKQKYIPVNEIEGVLYEGGGISLIGKRGKVYFPHFSEKSFDTLNACLNDVVELD